MSALRRMGRLSGALRRAGAFQRCILTSAVSRTGWRWPGAAPHVVALAGFGAVSAFAIADTGPTEEESESEDLKVTADPDETGDGEAPKRKLTPEEKAKAKAECPFCQFMRAGPCGEEFGLWEECLEEHEDGDYPTLCMKQTSGLTACMKQHMEYYGDFMPPEDKEKEGATGEASPAASGEAPKDDAASEPTGEAAKQ